MTLMTVPCFKTGLLFSDSAQSPHEEKLIEHLLMRYNRFSRPVAKERDSLEVMFGVSLQQIVLPGKPARTVATPSPTPT